mmetsp:Transcript_82492/g.145751  ORF Transcript_82492/g.145751 Transcript_82492/m.145751 type:complete len:267 (+) Transcript_82492:402-1202(+)
MQATYIVGEGNTNYCPSASVAITSQSECQQAATFLLGTGLDDPDGTGDWADSPKDCLYRERDGRGVVRFNRHKSGSAHGKQAPICKVPDKVAWFLSNTDLKGATNLQLWVSPFSCTVETAEPIAKAFGIEGRLEPGLGPIQDKTLKQTISADQWVAQLLEADAKRSSRLYDPKHKALVTPRIPEDDRTYGARVKEMADKLREKATEADMGPERHLLVVTHASLVVGLTAALTGRKIGKEGKIPEPSVVKLRGASNKVWKVMLLQQF